MIAIATLIGAIAFGIIGTQLGLDSTSLDVITGIAGALIFMKIFSLSKEIQKTK
jgi:hypothetical protein